MSPFEIIYLLDEIGITLGNIVIGRVVGQMHFLVLSVAKNDSMWTLS